MREISGCVSTSRERNKGREKEGRERERGVGKSEHTKLLSVTDVYYDTTILFYFLLWCFCLQTKKFMMLYITAKSVSNTAVVAALRNCVCCVLCCLLTFSVFPYFF